MLWPTLGQHCGKNIPMQGNFSDEIGHRFNLGPFHLWDNFIDEILLPHSYSPAPNKTKFMFCQKKNCS